MSNFSSEIHPQAQSAVTQIGHILISPPYRNVWSAAELQAKNEEWQVVCANIFGLEWSQGLRAMMDIRSPSSV
jgi:hypothetical protein